VSVTAHRDQSTSVDARQRVGFFTDTTVCIGCKACEVACKEWNQLPSEVTGLTGHSYDNTVTLDATHWRHVAFVEQPAPPLPVVAPGDVALPDSLLAQAPSMVWLMSSDVCKHCTEAACLDVCPTGSLVRTEFDTVVVQPDVCNGCGYCVPACPFGVIGRDDHSGLAAKCTLCYDRLRSDQTPACAQACPTDSIQFGPLATMRERAEQRLERLRGAGDDRARLYGHDEADGVGGMGALFLLRDEPEVYGLPPAPRTATRDLPGMWRAAFAAAGTLGAAIAGTVTLLSVLARSPGRRSGSR
jgi:formate dehydrogenase iron-sulfur subunit